MAATDLQEVSSEQDIYVEAFEGFARNGAAGQPGWLFPLRKAGLARFAELGFPTTKDEDWRFTNVKAIARMPFKSLHGADHRDAVDAETLKQFPFAELEGSRLVFVDGRFAEQLSVVRKQPEGVKVGNLAAALGTDSKLIEKHLGQYASDEKNAFAALNTAFFMDGGFVHVPKNLSVDGPVHLLFISTSEGEGGAVHPRNLVIAEQGAQAVVVETHVSLSDDIRLTNAVSEFVVDENATVEHIKFQDESTAAYHVATLHSWQGRASHFASHSIVTGAKLSRNNLRTKLDGEGLNCVLNGLYLTRGVQLADHHMIVEHAKPRCESHEYFNGILDDESRGVFHGRIYVHRVAQKTDAKQTNKNLLLSDRATANSKPQLEIYADDVKCTHGATIGQLDTDAIFYLRARGIDEETARRMLMHSFAGEIIDRIQCEPVRTELDEIVWKRLDEHWVGPARS